MLLYSMWCTASMVKRKKKRKKMHVVLITQQKKGNNKQNPWNRNKKLQKISTEHFKRISTQSKVIFKLLLVTTPLQHHSNKEDILQNTNTPITGINITTIGIAFILRQLVEIGLRREHNLRNNGIVHKNLLLFVSSRAVF